MTADELELISGVGPRMAVKLRKVGIFRISDLKDKDPEELYWRLCALEKMTVDRCVLYVFRAAVYYASTKYPDPRLLKWWAWKD